MLGYRFSFFFYADKGLLIAHKYIYLILSSNVNHGLDSKRKYFYCSNLVFLRPITAINFFIKNLFPYAYACRSIFAINNQFVDLYPSHISSYCRILHASLVRLSTILHKPSLEDLEHDIDYRLVSFAVKKNQSTDDSATANTRSRLIERLCTIFSRSFSSGLGSQRNNLLLANQPTRKVLCIFFRAKQNHITDLSSVFDFCNTLLSLK